MACHCSNANRMGPKLNNMIIVPSGPLSARTGDMVKLLVRACLCSFRSLEAVFRDGTLKLCPLVRSCAR